MNADYSAWCFMFVVIAAAVLASTYRGFQDNRRRETELGDWSAWAESAGFELSGSYPAFAIHGTSGGVTVNLRHEVEYGSKGAMRYKVEVSARLPASAGNLTVTRPGFLRRFFVGRDLPPTVASGELSVAGVPLEAGRLSRAIAAPGSVSEPHGIVAQRPERSRAEMAEDFARAWEVQPPGTTLPARVMEVLLDESHTRIEEGRVWFSRNGVLRSAEAKRVVATLVEIASSFR